MGKQIIIIIVDDVDVVWLAAPHRTHLNILYMKLFRVEESRCGQFVYFLCCCGW